MKNLSALILFVLFAHAANAQSADLQKIESILKKQLTGKLFLGGLYDAPCYGIEQVKISATGELVLTGAGGCNKTLFIKDASITTEGSKVYIRQSEPEINISFYTEETAILAKAFTDLRNILINAEKNVPVKKETVEIKTNSPEMKRDEQTGKKYQPLFNDYPLSMLESKATEPGLYQDAIKETQTKPDVKKTKRKVGNIIGEAVLYYNKTTQVAELFFNEQGKFYYYNRTVDIQYLDAVNKALAAKGFSLGTIINTNGATENTWTKQGYPYIYKIQYLAGQKKVSMAILDKDILK
ncbi:MAG TPA: hypothetical protein VK484_07180 [Ferruginibacter sp.]|nr:hypothetical protein [Ferruginibacter sp.]